ncbi:TadE/TadG family type IV pilus assembly protein [Desulfobaculum sp.]
MHHTRTIRRTPHARQRGLSVVEFSLLLPVVLGMILLIVELGNLYFTQSTLEKAASAGARFAVTGQGDMEGDRLARITGAVRTLSDTIALPEPTGPLTITVRSWPTTLGTGAPSEGNAGRPCAMMEVEVRCPYTPVTPLIGGMLADAITLTGSRRMINEPWLPCEADVVASQ